MSDAIKSVLIIDDHPLFRDALAMTLKTALTIPVLRTANSLTGSMEVLEQDFDPDAIVLDLNLPDVTGVEGLLRVKAAAPRTPVIVVSAASDNEVIAAVMAAGAAGFIPKDSTRETLIEAFRMIWSGEVYTPEGYHPPKQSEDKPALDSAVQRLSSLTAQQTRILELVCEGKLNKQIAHELSIAETTVKAHVTAILRKLGVHSRTQAVLIANEAKRPFKLL